MVRRGRAKRQRRQEQSSYGDRESNLEAKNTKAAGRDQILGKVTKIKEFKKTDITRNNYPKFGR